jgi:hypothetical protein
MSEKCGFWAPLGIRNRLRDRLRDRLRESKIAFR